MADSVCHTPSIFYDLIKTEILSRETSDLLKQVIFLKSINSVLHVTNYTTEKKLQAYRVYFLNKQRGLHGP